MAIRIRKVNGLTVALCAAETDPKDGDIYLDDGIHYALAAKFCADWYGHTVDWKYPEQWAAMGTQKLRDAKTELIRWLETQPLLSQEENAKNIMDKKYQIAQTYLLNVFLEPEEMEYLGEIKTTQYNGSDVVIKFDVFRRDSYGQPDLIALYNGRFFTRTHDNTVEGLTKAVGNAFRFEGKGYTHILVGDTRLTIEEFQSQVKDLLTEKEITETILLGRYFVRNKNGGEIKWCPQCQKIRQTTCSACGCGSCKSCEYRWCCSPQHPPFVTGYYRVER